MLVWRGLRWSAPLTRPQMFQTGRLSFPPRVSSLCRNLYSPFSFDSFLSLSYTWVLMANAPWMKKKILENGVLVKIPVSHNSRNTDQLFFSDVHFSSGSRDYKKQVPTFDIAPIYVFPISLLYAWKKYFLLICTGSGKLILSLNQLWISINNRHFSVLAHRTFLIKYIMTSQKHQNVLKIKRI